MNAADVMTRKVISVTPETTIADAARLMLKHRVDGLPVVDAGGTVVGVVTEGDLLRRAETGTERRHPRWLELLFTPGRLAEEYAQANARKIGMMMSADIVAVAPQEPLAGVVGLMERHHIKRLPVIEDGRLVGIVSRADLVRELAYRWRCRRCGNLLRARRPPSGCPRCGASNSFEEAPPLPAVSACPTCGRALDR